MRKIRKNKKNLKTLHNSYKYIIYFCAIFFVFNFFVEKIANQNQGKNAPQVQNINYNQAQSYKPDPLLNKAKKNIENKNVNNFKNLSVKERKQEFISNLLPIIHSANQDIIEKRNLFFKIEKKIQNNNLNVLESSILKKLFNEYRVKNNDLSELKKRIDIVPISLVIAQAAIESGWGTSRFAKEGNAYFGQKVIGLKANGITPSEIDNPSIKVRSFKNLNDSVKAYLNNLNTHFAYKSFRKSRNELRSFGRTLEGEKLAKGLKKYSELGNEYIINIQEIIKKNNLSKYDFIEYSSAER
tara:strand:- start:1421 stop:2314 length:894 start_codon:yes stop_codon:yes gene_type:complete